MTSPPTGRALVVTYLALVALAAASWLAAELGTGAAIALAIAAAKVAAIGGVFMELGAAHATDRIAVAIAVLFVLLLCAGAVADVALR
jgi:caa(3)-type oxidase subunit IV